jgi:hypothetical protein
MKAGKLNLLNADILIYKAAFPRHFNQLDGNAFDLLYCQCFGEMSERLKVPVLKTGVAQATVGSNPTLSAI